MSVIDGRGQPLLGMQPPFVATATALWQCDSDSDISDSELLAACHAVEARCEERRLDIVNVLDPLERDFLASQFDRIDEPPTPQRRGFAGDAVSQHGHLAAESHAQPLDVDLSVLPSADQPEEVAAEPQRNEADEWHHEQERLRAQSIVTESRDSVSTLAAGGAQPSLDVQSGRAEFGDAAAIAPTRATDASGVTASTSEVVAELLPSSDGVELHSVSEPTFASAMPAVPPAPAPRDDESAGRAGTDSSQPNDEAGGRRAPDLSSAQSRDEGEVRAASEVPRGRPEEEVASHRAPGASSSSSSAASSHPRNQHRGDEAPPARRSMRLIGKRPAHAAGVTQQSAAATGSQSAQQAASTTSAVASSTRERRDEEEEELESLPDDEKSFNTRLFKRVMRAAYGSSSAVGVVEDIMVSTRSRELVYLVRYSDGDLERFKDTAALDARIADLAHLERGRSSSFVARRVIDVGCSQDSPQKKDALSTERASGTDASKQSECPICLDSVVDTALDPCGHVLCANCSELFKRKPCPLCRKKVKRALRFYMP